jgi:hypothetical protein
VYNLWAALQRIGLRVDLINTEQLLAGSYTNTKVLILPRNERLPAGILQFINDSVVTAGVHILSDSDLPGLMDEYINSQLDFTSLMDSIFGINPIAVNKFQDVSAEYNYDTQRKIANVNLQGVT